MPGLAITNLGRLDYPNKYGSLELERFIFITSGTQYMELVIPVVTVAGKLTFTINYSKIFRFSKIIITTFFPVIILGFSTHNLKKLLV